jgi:hypothetical protein
MKKTLLLAAAVICAAFLLASCDKLTGGNNSNTPSNTNNGNGNKNGGDKTNSNSTTSSTGGEIGVPECDAFLKKYEECLDTKVPEAQRGAMKPGLDAWKKSWKDMAATEQGKVGLKAACTQAEASAKTSMSSFGCSW